MVIYQYRFFYFFDNWWVSVYIPRLIVDEYMSFIFKIVEHWNIPYLTYNSKVFKLLISAPLVICDA